MPDKVILMLCVLLYMTQYSQIYCLDIGLAETFKNIIYSRTNYTEHVAK